MECHLDMECSVLVTDIQDMDTAGTDICHTYTRAMDTGEQPRAETNIPHFLRSFITVVGLLGKLESILTGTYFELPDTKLLYPIL